MKRPVEFITPAHKSLLVAGVDEAGRGALVGPVFAAAVILHPSRPIAGLADSKVLSKQKRALLYATITQKALLWSVAWADASEIDQHNILQATLLAMRRAVEKLSMAPVHVLVDGNVIPSLPMAATAIVQGDATVPAISAASILAKVSRDHWCSDLHHRFPHYGFQTHKGYPTAQHIAALRVNGPCPEHRRSFRPVREICP